MSFAELDDLEALMMKMKIKNNTINDDDPGHTKVRRAGTQRGQGNPNPKITSGGCSGNRQGSSSGFCAELGGHAERAWHEALDQNKSHVLEAELELDITNLKIKL